jgi:hypothetical protein
MTDTNRDAVYLGRDSPWRAVTRRSVDVWAVARVEPTDVAQQTSPTPFIQARKARNRSSLTSGHFLPLAA